MNTLAPENLNTVGIGAIGLGDHSASHIPFLEEVDGCEITAIADRDETRLVEVRNRLLLPENAAFTDHLQLLGSEAVHAVVVTNR